MELKAHAGTQSNLNFQKHQRKQHLAEGSFGGTSPASHSQSSPLLAALAEANRHLSDKRYVEAMLAYSSLVDSSEVERLGLLADAYAGRSDSLRHLEQLYHSLEDAGRVCLLRPRWPRGHALRGEALLAGDQFADALAAFREAARHEPGDELLLERARFCVDRLRYEAGARRRLALRCLAAAAALATFLTLLDLAALGGIVHSVLPQTVLYPLAYCLAFALCYGVGWGYARILAEHKRDLLRKPIDLLEHLKQS